MLLEVGSIAVWELWRLSAHASRRYAAPRRSGRGSGSPDDLGLQVPGGEFGSQTARRSSLLQYIDPVVPANRLQILNSSSSLVNALPTPITRPWNMDGIPIHSQFLMRAVGKRLPAGEGAGGLLILRLTIYRETLLQQPTRETLQPF